MLSQMVHIIEIAQEKFCIVSKSGKFFNHFCLI